MADPADRAAGSPFVLGASVSAFLDAAPDAMVIVAPDGRVRVANQQARALFGYDDGELEGQPVEILIPPRYRTSHPLFRTGYGHEPRIRPMGTGRALFAQRKDGTEFPAEISLGPIATSDGVFVTAAVRDITERLRHAEEQRAARRAIEIADELQAGLREREILLQEVHHRVKNNLQVISSLINMQRRRVGDGRAQAALLECQTRVQAIGLIHEQLYRYGDYARVPFAAYVQGLVGRLDEAFGRPGRVRVQLDVSTAPLPVDKAIPCGLILNELVTNAFKHAFPGESRGTIRVRLEDPVDGRVRLTVEDDGAGMPPTATADAPSLGLQLVQTLVAQLQGALAHESTGGTRWVITFPLEAS